MKLVLDGFYGLSSPEYVVVDSNFVVDFLLPALISFSRLR